jgi:hypothetical protein
MFLSPEDLANLTDTKRVARQIEWLTNRGYKFDISITGRPKVLVKELESRLLSNKKAPQKQRPAPRLDILDQVGAK